MTKMIVEPGTILLGKYIVERVVGKGGMGIVVAARHMDLDELFAIKLLLESDLEQTEPIERFLREARACAKLKSEHAVRVHDFGRLPSGTPYMVMEYLAGQDLREILKTRKTLPAEEAVQYVLEACKAIAEAHAMGIVHRDLKPANIFLAQRPAGPPLIKVLDFGISKELDPQERVGADLTRTGALLGSPNYMSPEQMTHVKSADARSDIWSLGVVLFQLTTGKLPFQGTILTEIIARVLTEDVPRPRALQPNIPPELEAIVLRCLEKNPDKRFQSVRDLSEALGTVIAKESPRIRPTEFSLADTLKRPSLDDQALSRATQSRTRSSNATLSETEIPTRNAWGQEATEKSLHRNRQGLVVFFVAATVLVGGSIYVMVGTNPETTEAPTSASTTSVTTTAEIVVPPAISVIPVDSTPTTTASASASASTPPAIAAPRTTSRPVRPATTSGRNLPGFDD